MSDPLDELFMATALEEARSALEEGMFPVGAVVVQNGKIVSRRHKFRCGIQSLDHAEMLTLRDVEIVHARKAECTIYSNLEPCTMCFGTILNLHIPRVVFGLEDPYDGYAKCFTTSHATLRHQDRMPVVLGGVLRAQSRALFREYFLTTNHVFWKHAHTNPLVQICKDE